jgi:hypothetical protein
MLHPDTKLEWISDTKGFGVIATRKIPRGSITFAQDDLDISIALNNPLLADPKYQKIVEKFSYMNCEGEFVISWDHGKYMNHCCFSNTLTTGYGFEIAIEDIEEGQEVTDDYGIFTVNHNMAMSCPKEGCYKTVGIENFERHQPRWDKSIINALKDFKNQSQPLEIFLSDDVRASLSRYLETGEGYVSVENQKPGIKQVKFYQEIKAE